MFPATALREAPWPAGIFRPMDGFDGALEVLAAARTGFDRRDAEERAKDDPRRVILHTVAPEREAVEPAEEVARRLCELQAGSGDLRALDFHSFRRAFATGLAS